jgi:prepilin-type N-terminal cleavage/methylation domain-containing protein
VTVPLRSHENLQAPRAVAGFTLIEVVLAMVVLSAGVLGLVHLAGAAVLTTRDARAATSIGVYAENALEATRDRGFAGTSPGVTSDTLNLRGIRYARRVTITDRDVRTREVRVEMVRVTGAELAYSTLTYLVR